MQYNDKATFYRSSSSVLDQWTDQTACAIANPKSPAFLSIQVDIPVAGTLAVNGFNVAGITITETLSFIESGIQLSMNEFKSITTLTPTWSTYKINIKAEDKQGQPIESLTTFGPYLVNVSNITSDRLRDNVNVTGWEKSQWLIAFIESFQPEQNDQVSTSRGWNGWVQDIVPIAQVNFPKGWQFFIVINK